MTDGKIEVVKTFWKERDFPFNDIPDRPHSEIEYLDGVKHGRCRLWHENGQLAFEGWYRHGIPDGVGICWNRNGRELCRHEVVNGTGVARELIVGAPYPFIVDTPWVNGVKHGISRHLTLDGRIMTEWCFLNGRNVAMSEYERACVQDPTLPRHETDRSKWAATGDARWTELLEKREGVYEARAWFAGEQGPRRTLGEDTDHAQSVAIVEPFYRAGARAVYVFEVDEVSQNSGRLLVELPDDKQARKAVLRVGNKWARKLGFDPDRDQGQRYVLILLD